MGRRGNLSPGSKELEASQSQGHSVDESGVRSGDAGPPRWPSGKESCLPMQKTWARSLAWKDQLEEEMATHSSIFAWKIPWTEELGGLQSMGSQRGGHVWACMPVFPLSGLELTW